MNARIAYLRNFLKLSRAEFGEKLGVIGPAVGNWERGKNVPYNKITLICERFNVNREWLVNGTGEIFQRKEGGENKPPEVTPYEYARMQGCDYTLAKVFEALCAMNDRDKEAISRLIDQILKSLEEDAKNANSFQTSPKIYGTNVQFRDYHENNGR